jgi:hypothetical protein
LFPKKLRIRLLTAVIVDDVGLDYENEKATRSLSAKKRTLGSLAPRKKSLKYRYLGM